MAVYSREEYARRPAVYRGIDALRCEPAGAPAIDDCRFPGTIAISASCLLSRRVT